VHKLDEQLVQQAQLVLDLNWNGEYTQPGPRLYPHQWSWDSALIAMGYAHYAQDRATTEITHLFDSQWNNGLLPQIVFNPRFGEYFPGIDFWHAERSPNAPRESKTSGVVQPPIHATAVLYVYRHAQDEAAAKEFLGRLFPKLRAWHDYLYRERDPEGEGLVYIRHPWESGMDNSPMWDSIMERLQLLPEQIPKYRRADTHFVTAGDRPLDAAYDRFAYLVKFFADRDYDEAKIREDCPFLVQDVLFNALLCRADQDLAQMARVLGEDPTPLEKRTRKTARAMNEKLWDEQHGIYLDFDLTTGRPSRSMSRRTSCPFTRPYPTKGGRVEWLTPWRARASAFRTNASLPCRATTITASPSSRPATGGDQSGSTSTGCSCEAWNATATKSKPSAYERPSSHCAETRASTSTTTQRPALVMDPTCSPGRPPFAWT
jgi:hypothetical protein